MKSQLLANSLQVLQLIAAAPGPLTLKDLAQQCQMSPSSLGRIIADLSEAQLVEKPTYHQVVAAPGLWALGDLTRRNSLWTKKIAPYLEKELLQLQVSGQLGTVSLGEVVITFQYQLPEEHYPWKIVPLWDSAIAWVALAQMSSWTEFEALLRKSRGEKTASPGTAATWSTQFAELQQRGYLITQEYERRVSVTCPLKIWNYSYALQLISTVSHRSSPDLLLMECSRLCNRISSAF